MSDILENIPTRRPLTPAEIEEFIREFMAGKHEPINGTVKEYSAMTPEQIAIMRGEAP